MPNPLTLMAVTPRGGTGPDTSQSSDRASKSGLDFEAAMNEEAEHPVADPEAVAAAAVDQITPAELPEAEDSAPVLESQVGDAPAEDHSIEELAQSYTLPVESDVTSIEPKVETDAISDQTQVELTSVAPKSANEVTALQSKPTTETSPIVSVQAVEPRSTPTNGIEVKVEQSTAPQPKNVVSVMEGLARSLKHDPLPEAHNLAAPDLVDRQPAQASKSATIAAPQITIPTLIGVTDKTGPEIETEPQDLSALRETATGQIQREGISYLSSLPARPETARLIAGQMAAVISAKPGSGAVEIALNPEELGRVSITLNGRDDGMHLVILAERPETLDLMRRHVAILSAEFERLGYGGLSLDLGTSGDAPPERARPEFERASNTNETTGDVETTARPIRIDPDRGLDMRL